MPKKIVGKGWTETRMTNIRLWIKQFASLAYSYTMAIRYYKKADFFLNFMNVFGGFYLIPTAGCGLVSGEVCVGLQWSGIVIGVIVGICGGMSYVLDLPSKMSCYESANVELMQIARDIGLELDKDPEDREICVDFSKDIIKRYDSAIKGATLPWYIRNEQQFLNINLLQSYLTVPPSESRDMEQDQVIVLTENDRAVMQRLDEELQRLRTEN